MGFDVSYVVDILKFPWPLFPKNKNPFPLGLRYNIPAIVQKNEFTIELPAGNTFELVSMVFSSTGYKDGDKFSLIKNNEYILKDIYTKELGQVKEIRPLKEIKSDTDTLKFIFNNITGTSKVIWIDVDMTCLTPIAYDPGNPFMRETAEVVKSAIPYLKENDYPELKDINTDYWSDDLIFGGKPVRKRFWDGRNDILNAYSMYPNKVKSTDTYREFIYQLSVDSKNEVKHKSFDMDWTFFKDEYNHLIEKDFNILQLAEIYLSYRLGVPVSIFKPAYEIVNNYNIDLLLLFIKKEFMFVFDWIDFNEVNPNSKVLGFELNPYSLYNDNKRSFKNKIKSFINIEPSAFNSQIVYSGIIAPKEYCHKEDSLNALDIQSLENYGDDLNWHRLHIHEPSINFVETFIHEMGHSIDGYQRDNLGLRFCQYPEWLKISGWELDYFSKYDYNNYPFLKVSDYKSKLLDIEPPVTPYGCTNPLEDFAETFSMYCINPLCLQTDFPKRWKFFEDNVCKLAVKEFNG